MRFLSIIFIFITIQKAIAQDKDSIIITRDLVQVTFTNKMRLQNLVKIAKAFEEKEMSIRYVEKEFDENGYLQRLHTNIKYKNQGYEVINDTIFNNQTRVGFNKDLRDFPHDSINIDCSEPFSKIEQVPIHPNCMRLKKSKAQKDCLSKEVQMHVSKRFNVDLAQDLGLTPGKKRIFVMFKISKKGEVIDVIARAPHERLEIEAIRVVSTLPKMIPGKQKDKPVGVKYSLPISFIIQESRNKRGRKKRNNTQQIIKKEPFSLYYVDELPAVNIYETFKDKNDAIKSFKKNIKMILENEFDSSQIKNIGIGTGRKRVFADFIIKANGDIANIEPYTDYEELEEEVIRVIKKLPKIQPGKKNGTTVDVKHTTSITFTIDL